MPESASLSGNIDQIDLGCIEREATPRLLMKLSIQLHFAGLSLSNTVFILETFGVERLVLLFIIGFTRPIYSLNPVDVQITLRLTRL